VSWKSYGLNEKEMRKRLSLIEKKVEVIMENSTESKPLFGAKYLA
jgi:hypothetical protein